VRVDASDELSNPPDRVTRHTLESTTVVLDTTAPVLDKVALRANRLSGVATDGASNIARIEMQLVGGSTWFPLFPTDGVLDEPSEAFDADVATLVPPAKPFVWCAPSTPPATASRARSPRARRRRAARSERPAPYDSGVMRPCTGVARPARARCRRGPARPQDRDSLGGAAPLGPLRPPACFVYWVTRDATLVALAL